MPQSPLERLQAFTSQRPDGRHANTLASVYHRLKHNEPKLAFDPAVSPAQFARWKTKVRAKLRELMHFPKTATQPKPRMIFSQPRDGYRLERWELFPEDGVVTPILMLVPDNASEQNKAPAVLCIPGSSNSKESLAGEPELDGVSFFNRNPQRNRMALHYARAGMVAVAVDHPAMCENDLGVEDPNHDDVVWFLIWLGRCFESLSTFHKLRVVHWMRTLPFIDSKRLAVSGHSLGAKPALLLGLLEPAVRAVVWNDFAGNWRTRQLATMLVRRPSWQFVPGLIEWFDYLDLMAALAPKPMIITEGGRTDEIALVKKAYRIAGAPAALKVAYYPKFDTPAKRPFDRQPIPTGIDDETYLQYANVDVPNHCFKETLAVPWLKRILK